MGTELDYGSILSEAVELDIGLEYMEEGFFSSVAALNDGVIGPVASGFQEPDSTTGAPHDRSAEGRRS